MPIKGKVFLIVTRTNEEGEEDRFDVHSYIQKCAGGWEHKEALQIELDNLDYFSEALPPRVNRLCPGETIRMVVTVEVHYRLYESHEGFREVEPDIYFNRVRTRRVQKYRPRYIAKERRHGTK